MHNRKDVRGAEAQHREADQEREKQQERDARSHEHDDYNLPFTD
jgi:hypothetical protein